MKLIDKAALVAELEKRTDELYDLLPNASKVEDGIITISEACNTGKYTALESFRKYIDTLEVKEVDLEREIDDYINEHFSECDDGVLISDANSTELTLLDVTSIARHFFELGVKVQKL